MPTAMGKAEVEFIWARLANSGDNDNTVVGDVHVWRYGCIPRGTSVFLQRVV